MAKSKSLNSRSRVLKQEHPVSMVEKLRGDQIAKSGALKGMAGKPANTRNNDPGSLSVEKQAERKLIRRHEDPLIEGFDRLPDEAKSGNGSGYGVSYDDDNEVAGSRNGKPMSGKPKGGDVPSGKYESSAGRDKHGRSQTFDAGDARKVNSDVKQRKSPSFDNFGRSGDQKKGPSETRGVRKHALFNNFGAPGDERKAPASAYKKRGAR